MRYLRCNDPVRAQRWVEAVGENKLPILPGDPTITNGEPCYMIDFRRLTKEQRETIAQQTATWFNASLDDVMYRLTRYGLPAPIGDCELIEVD